jgi:hypothetical protein
VSRSLVLLLVALPAFAGEIVVKSPAKNDVVNASGPFAVLTAAKDKGDMVKWAVFPPTATTERCDTATESKLILAGNPGDTFIVTVETLNVKAETWTDSKKTVQFAEIASAKKAPVGSAKRICPCGCEEGKVCTCENCPNPEHRRQKAVQGPVARGSGDPYRVYTYVQFLQYVESGVGGYLAVGVADENNPFVGTYRTHFSAKSGELPGIPDGLYVVSKENGVIVRKPFSDSVSLVPSQPVQPSVSMTYSTIPSVLPAMRT